MTEPVRIKLEPDWSMQAFEENWPVISAGLKANTATTAEVLAAAERVIAALNAERSDQPIP